MHTYATLSFFRTGASACRLWSSVLRTQARLPDVSLVGWATEVCGRKQDPITVS